MPATDWHADALCLEYPNLPWFAEQGQTSDKPKAVCRRCAVRSECLAFALEHNIDHGIWGGTSPRQRKQLSRAGATGALVRTSDGAWFLAS
jgi:WhiB family redox-sensing transcriptional regulator